MTIQVRTVRAQPGIQPPGAMGEGRFGGGRLIQMALALYLVPALLVVLLVGGVGLVVLAAARTITWIARGPKVGTRSPIDPESPST
jgi:hypothetical protein